MNKTYISSLLVVLMAGVQVQAQMETEPAAAPVEEAVPAAVKADASAEPKSLFDIGVQFYKDGDYAQARVNFEAVLAKDPYNKKAMTYLSKTTTKIHALELRKIEAVREDAMTQIAESWAPSFEDALMITEQASTVQEAPVPVGIQKMEAALKGIMIPSLVFDDANIKDVVLSLIETSRRLDKSGKGVNMILLGLDSSDEMGSTVGNNITLSIRDLSLYDLLQVVTEMASLKFAVEANMVMIMPADYVRPVEVETATFSVIPEVGEDLSSMSDGGGGGDSMDDLFGGGDTSSMSADSGPVDVSGFFSIVPWPRGAKATYYPNFRKLIVQNTHENIAKVRSVISDLEDEAITRRSSQVEIEAKFVEFSEGVVEELGFNWTVAGSGSVAGFNMVNDGSIATYTPSFGYLSTQHLANFSPTTGAFIERDQDLSQKMAGDWLTYDTTASGVRLVEDGQSLFGGAVRSGSDAFTSVTTGILQNMGGDPASMLFSDGTFDMQINALEQNGTADILSCPKVTTQSGYEAVIRVTEIHRYPQDWDVETGQRTAPVVKPQDWEDFDLGVVLRVTPEVDSESNTIKLELNPEIRTFRGFDGYHVADNAYDAGTSYDEVIRGDGTELFAEMPYFETRSVQTRVTVADGSTVMMGGLVDESTETFRDQVPILGDLPFVGRLFRTEGTRSSKKNLVIFVKATQVDEKGMTREDRQMAQRAVAGN